MTFQPNTARLEQANYRHLVLDVVWFGLGFVAINRFLPIFAIHVGATPTELGLITALPPLVVLLASFAGPAWRARYSSDVRAHFWPGMLYKASFLLPAFTPLFPLPWQPIWLILSVTVPAAPQALSMLLFFGIMRDSMSPSRLTHLLGQRSLWFSVVLAVGSLVCGLWLERMPYPINYQIMFALSAIASMMSFFHVNAIRPIREAVQQHDQPKTRVSPWRSRGFREVTLVTAGAHVTFTALVAVIPLYMVQRMHATEGFMALFGLVELGAGALMSLAAPWLVRRLGNRGMVALMMGGTALSALALALAPSLPFTLIGAALSGGCWMSAAMIGVFGVFTDRTPAGDVAYSTAYSQVSNLAAFVGPLLGSALVTGGLDLLVVMLVGAALRAGAMVVIGYPGVTQAKREVLASAEP